ncbi:MAG: hypothetical protein CM1200mP9_12300 [Gammaproteobacteria bacterium]|nr:MAG: hypothetical protein CM1200mP9_12300 [Gammaproteobacteria bacterium]
MGDPPTSAAKHIVGIPVYQTDIPSRFPHLFMPALIAMASLIPGVGFKKAIVKCARGVSLDRFLNFRIEIGHETSRMRAQTPRRWQGGQGSGDGFNDPLLRDFWALIVVGIVWGDVLFGDRD